MTYYDLLEIAPNAPADDVRRAYHRAVRRYHPDVNPSPDAAQRTALLNDAWATLRDPAARAAYDRSIRPQPQPQPQPQGYAQTWSGSYEPYRHEYEPYAYKATVTSQSMWEAPPARFLFGSLRGLVFFAFIASAFHWWPAIAGICIAVFALRFFGRLFR